EHKNLILNIFKYAMKFLNPSHYTSSPPFSNPTTLNGFNAITRLDVPAVSNKLQSYLVIETLFT
ncbi:MAG: hypothetical protein K8S56_10430, partial [Candidatus Cloacimonetes bacterium]|nr:hypothetical protein [Candidatus Cloacimonadota bacterium]